MKIISDIFTKIKEFFIFSFTKQNKINQAVVEVNQTIEGLQKVIKEYETSMADNTISLVESVRMVNEIKQLIEQLIKTKESIESIFK